MRKKKKDFNRQAVLFGNSSGCSTTRVFFILMQVKIDRIVKDLQDETFLYKRIKQPLEKYFCGLGMM